MAGAHCAQQELGGLPGAPENSGLPPAFRSSGCLTDGLCLPSPGRLMEGTWNTLAPWRLLRTKQVPGGRLRAAVEDLRCSGHTREQARGRTRLGKASSTVPESGISTHKSRAQAARPRSPAGLPGEGLAMPKHSCRGWKTGMFLPMGRYEHQVTKSMKTRGEVTKTRGPRKAPETNYKNESARIN